MDYLSGVNAAENFRRRSSESDEYDVVLRSKTYGNATDEANLAITEHARQKRIERQYAATAIPELKQEIYFPIRDPLEIRVLILEPSSARDGSDSNSGPGPTPLRCSLQHVSLELDSLTETNPDGSVAHGSSSYAIDVVSGRPVWYTALSYQWGPPNFTCPVDILVNAGLGSTSETETKLFRKFITPNLSAALHHLRHPSAQVVLWIDQLCIDQFDNEEKSVQVALMGRIYERALNTTVWLGDEPEDGVFEVLAAVRDGFQFTTDEVGDESIYERLILPCERTHAWRLLMRFFSRPWFLRAWVMQEVILSKKTIIRCGPGLKEDKSDSCRLDWHDFGAQCLTGVESGYFAWLDRKEGDNGKNHQGRSSDTDRFLAAKIAADLSTRSSMHHGRMTTMFGSALVEARYAEATDLRDKVYAVLGPTSEQFDIDYTATAPEVFRRATAAIIAADIKTHRESEAGSSLQVKYKAEWEKGSMRDPKGLEMDHFQTTRMLCSVDHGWMDGQPSWVPDWGKPRATFALGYDTGTKMLHHAGHGALIAEKVIELSPDGMVLTFAGKLVDKIGDIGRICLSPGDLYPNSGTNETLINLIEFAKECSPKKSDSDEDDFDVIWKTLVAGMDKRVFEKKTQPPEITASEGKPREDARKADHLPQKKQKKKKKKKAQREKPARRPAWERNVLEVQMAYGQAMRNRRLCVTEERRLLMLAPAMSQQGDVVAVFAGIGMPFVLRPKKDGKFKLVGHCYVHGLMEREVNGMGLETRIIELV